MKGKRFIYEALLVSEQKRSLSKTNSARFVLAVLFLCLADSSLFAQPGTFKPDDFFAEPFSDESIYIPPVSMSNIETLSTNVVIAEPIKVERVKSKHDPAVEVNRTIIRTKLYIVVYTSDLGNNLYIRESIEITSEQVELRYGLRIGMKKEGLLRVIGKPDETSSRECTEYLYYYSKWQDPVIIFKITEGHLYSVLITTGN